MRKRKNKKISEECFNLNYELIKWLNEHLKVYLEEANKIVNLEYDKYKYRGKECNFKELLEKLINITDNLLIDDEYVSWNYEENIKIAKRQEALKNSMYDILKLIHWGLWW